MNLHEYQGKKILQAFGVKIQRGLVVTDPEEAVKAARKLSEETDTKMWVVKAQIHAGGRGKGGGVKVAKSLEEVREKASQILGMQLVTPQTSKDGKTVHQVMIAEDVYYPGASKPEEYYMSVLLNRATGKNMIMYSTEGGMDIEQVALATPEKIFMEEIDPVLGIQAFQAGKIAFNLGFSGLVFKEFTKFVTALYQAYVGCDASLFEINPVLKTSDNQILAVDAKVELDNNALFRHADYAAMRDCREEDPTDVEASDAGLNFIKLDGNVACMVNGAGLAMATMDMIKLSGGNPANFLDVGGTADVQRVETAFRIILKDSAVEAILVNIYGGIVRCDRVAQGIIDAYKNIGNEIRVPIVVRLQGTNSEKAKKMIDDIGLSVYSVFTLEEAAQKVKEMLA
ncbi:MAG: ADP-forming succinate--CoA ligase subunit beta [Flavobacteriales bacterium Tduv]